MTKRSIGSLMRQKLSDITNSQSQTHNQHKLLTEHENHPIVTVPTDNHSIQQLLKERVTLKQLIAERDEIIELNGAELQRLREDIKKLQLQNWNLARSNSHMLAEINMGREMIKTLQHELSLRAALLKGKGTGVQEGDEKAGQPSPKDSNIDQHNHMSRRRIRSRSTGPSLASTKNASKDKDKDTRIHTRRHSATLKRHEELEPLENLFEIEDAILSSHTVKDETGKGFAPRSSFGRPMRRAAEKVQSYKERPINVKLRRLA